MLHVTPIKSSSGHKLVKFNTSMIWKSRLRWYGHVMRRDEGVGIRRVLEFEVASEIRRGRPPMGWKEQVEKDMVKAGLRHDDAQVRVAWRHGVSGFSSSADKC
jgi:hypothetical protein